MWETESLLLVSRKTRIYKAFSSFTFHIKENVQQNVVFSKNKRGHFFLRKKLSILVNQGDIEKRKGGKLKI